MNSKQLLTRLFDLTYTMLFELLTMPREVLGIIHKLNEAGYQAYVVGGCVRDLLLGKKPKDWDVTTNAAPDKIQKIFPESVYENAFGTVGVKTGSEDETLKIIEVTTFRLEGKYSDLRHPDEVKFAKTLEEDLGRRDFTVNAMALNVKYEIRNTKYETNSKSQTLNYQQEIIDLYGGQSDLKHKLIRAVGEPEKRFQEDALRMTRAVRLASELDFNIEEKTLNALKQNVALIKIIAPERIRDEFIKLISSEGAGKGVALMAETGLLKFIIPELDAGIGVTQNKHHIYTVFEHNLRALEYAAARNYSFKVRLASLLHDVGKVQTKRGEGQNATFYGHEIVGARITKKILERLRFSQEIVHIVTHLVRYHLFYYNVDEVSASGVRRFIRRVGKENIEDLLKVREADRIGSGVPKAVPYRLRHLKFMIDKVMRDPVSVKELKINGNDVMELLKIQPGPKIGFILNILLGEVLDDPAKNEMAYQFERVKALGEMSEDNLKKISKSAVDRKDEFEQGVEDEMKKGFYVK